MVDRNPNVVINLNVMTGDDIVRFTQDHIMHSSQLEPLSPKHTEHIDEQEVGKREALKWKAKPPRPRSQAQPCLL